MKAKTTPRNQWLSVRLSAEEEKLLRQLLQRTTAQSLSEYARDVLLKAPVTVRYRNASADAFLEEMIRLKAELTAMNNRFDQVVHQLQQMHQVTELKAWIILQEASRQELQKKTSEILEKVSQIYTLWSQE
jgi:MobC-like protein